jgi:hypothetical protein
MGPDARRSLATALVVLASLLLLVATLSGYARRALFEPQQFADRATATLDDSSVRTLIGDRVTDRVVLRQNADCWPRGPLIASAISGVVGGRAFGSLFHRAALDAHRAVFEHDENTVTLTVADIGTVAAAAIRVVRPSLSARPRGQRAGSMSSTTRSAPRAARRCASPATCASSPTCSPP